MKKSFAIFLLLLNFSLFTNSCKEKIKPSIINAKIEGVYPTQESWDSRITFTREGKLLAILEVKHLLIYEDRKETLLEDGIKVDFYDEQQKHTTTLIARRGTVNDMTKDLAAYGNVIVTSEDGTTLKTEKLFWKNNTQKIETDAYVEIDSPKEKIRGTGLVSDQNLKNYKIINVTGQTTKVD